MPGSLLTHDDETLPREALLERFRQVRDRTRRLVAPLSAEDCVVQSMPDVSPTRWHLAHTTWFFERFFLSAADGAYRPFHPDYEKLFNSYYETVGTPFPRSQRGLLSRPTVDEVLAYRRAVEQRVEAALEDGGPAVERLLGVVRIGLEHEQQHQELILTDIKHVLSMNPLLPGYRSDAPELPEGPGGPQTWTEYEGGLRWIGHGGEGFAFDNEGPRHRTFVQPHELANRLVTNEEYAEFIADGGYDRADLWLAEGYDLQREEGWRAPLYWLPEGRGWSHFTLSGRRPLPPRAPVCHVSFFEADAYARWAGARLPTEAEWESAAVAPQDEGNFAESGYLEPRPDEGGPPEDEGPRQMFGDAWEWTASAYDAYPGYQPAAGAIGEYNGKFMCNQYVLRGGSCATPRAHIRRTYRNFFPTAARWQLSGIRLARD